MPLRALTEDDAAVVERFVAMAAFPPDRELPAGALGMSHARRWLEDWGRELGVGWEEDGKLVGAAWARRVEPVLARDASGSPLPEVIVAVDRPARGAGIGQRLMEGLVDPARERGVAGLVLSVSERNLAAVRLYERVGFTHAGRTACSLLRMLWRLERDQLTGEGVAVRRARVADARAIAQVHVAATRAAQARCSQEETRLPCGVLRGEGWKRTGDTTIFSTSRGRL
jgi:GNAT superfamily N-acetyltransferase